MDQWRRVVKPNRNLPCSVQKVAKLRPVALPAHTSVLLSAPDFCALSLSSLFVSLDVAGHAFTVALSPYSQLGDDGVLRACPVLRDDGQGRGWP